MPAVVTCCSESELESADRLAVDRTTDVQYGGFVGARKVQVGGDPTGAAEPSFSKAGSSFENQFSAVEEALLIEHPQQVVLRDIQKRGSVGVVAASGAVK